ncbi:major facilitator superfamily transporter [Lactarius vividus]|nr:major facilitator superfamily transporter [Lactarius vividus]
MTFQGTPKPQEETPLLRDGNVPRMKTPLPITQVVVLFLLELCEPITSQSIRPYINQLVSDLPVVGGDEKRVGYYAGLIVSLFFATEAVTVLQWSRLSDKVGRKPVLLFGLLGTIISSILFGLSRSFPALVLSRCLNGMLNGNTGVMKSMMAELTDETNMAQGFLLLSVTWAVGCTIGFGVLHLSFVISLIPGHVGPSSVVCYRGHKIVGQISSHILSGASTHTSCHVSPPLRMLSYHFLWPRYYLEERHPSLKPNTEVNSDLPQVGEGELLDGYAKDTEDPVTIACLANETSRAGALIPLVWSTSVEFGGLGMSPASIGLWMAGYGSMTCIIQFVAFSRLVERFGPRGVFIACIILFFPVYFMFPFENLVLRHSSRGLNLAAGLLVTLQISAMSFADMGFSVIYMYIASAAPNKRSLGATNGLAQTMVSIQRAIGPAAAASLFAFSLEKNILGGNFAYVVMLAIVWVGLGAAVQLPKNMWKQ